METSEVLHQLWAWTPFLLEGFGWNVLIATCASVMGSVVGGGLVWMQLSRRPALARAGALLTESFCRIPTLALMFYCAVLLPHEFELPGSPTVRVFAAWIKATIALSAAQIGFTAQNLGPALQRWRNGEHSAALLFIPNWGTNLLITIIASSGASLVGVSEIVSRCNKIISAMQNTYLLVPLYLYASLYFLALCYPLTYAMRRLRAAILRRMERQRNSHDADSGVDPRPS